MRLHIRPTALQVITGHNLHGRCAIITGGASGIVAETVRALATVGARVIIATRDASKAEPVAAALRTDTGNPSIVTATLDLAAPVRKVIRASSTLRATPTWPPAASTAAATERCASDSMPSADADRLEHVAGLPNAPHRYR
jgi:NAD(P)-dependent dehydrogenase (short-subunit alcohol dehydrogenase family)